MFRFEYTIFTIYSKLNVAVILSADVVVHVTVIEIFHWLNVSSAVLLVFKTEDPILKKISFDFEHFFILCLGLLLYCLF